MSNICDDLRAAILQAAMQGKLTEQLPEDGDAEDLFKKSIAKKESAIKNGLVKKQKSTELLISTPFDIPDSWCWAQLSDLVYIYSGLAYSKKDLDEKIIDEVTVFRGGNISNMSYCFKSDDVKIDKKFIPKGELFLRKNQLITPAVTSQSNLGKIARIDTDYANVVAGGFVLNIVPYDINNDVFSKLFCYFFSSPFYKERCNEIANKSGQAFYNLNRTKLQKSAFPLPPLAEQKRIVEKVDELMSRVADLEQSADALASLKKAFPDDIKASLLQYAMQGKLTKQLPEDGSAEDLLEKIKAEKEMLITEGKIKKQKPLAPIADEEIPFSIPENWKWTRLAELFQFINGDRGKNYPSKNKLHASGKIPFISAINMKDGTVREDNLLYADKSTYDKLGNGKLSKDDFVICIRGSLGKYCKYPYAIGAIASSLVIVRKYSDSIFDDYFSLYLQSTLMSNEIHEKDNGTAQPNLSAADLMNFLIPLPPYAEQKRIVERLNSLLQNISTVGELIASE